MKIAVMLAGALLVGAWCAAEIPSTPLIAPDPQPSAAPPEQKVRVLAIEGTQEGQASAGLDEELRGLASVLSHLPYDTYRKAAGEERAITPGTAEQIPLNADYRLELRPDEPSADGMTKLECRVLRAGAESGEDVKAIGATAMLPSRGMLKLEGLKTAKGELIVLVQLLQEGGESQQSGDGQQQEEQQKEQQQQGTKEDEQKEQQQTQADQMDAQESEEKQADKQDDLQNLEAILQSLENMDKRELQDVVNNREEIGMRGDHWW